MVFQSNVTKHMLFFIFKKVCKISNCQLRFQSNANNKLHSLSKGLGLNFFSFYKNKLKDASHEKTNRYWLIDDISQLLEEADRLYYEENYLEVYETLNRLKYQDNIEVQWRICRALFKMCSLNQNEKMLKEHMIEEAFNIISRSIKLNDNHSQVQKWMALILDMKSNYDGIFSRLQAAPTVRQHMQKSLELNPQDPVLLHMLGIWCYEISKLNWFEKQIAKLLFYSPPNTSKEEAYRYFLRAEQVKPRFFLGNIYMLGLCSYDLGMYFRARYYLKIASELPIKSELEREYSKRAKSLCEKLKEYDIDSNILSG